MYHLMKIDGDENGETVIKGLSAKTEKDLLNKAVKQGLCTEFEKQMYKKGQPCLCIVKADTYEKALKEMQTRFAAAGFGNLELKN